MDRGHLAARLDDRHCSSLVAFIFVLVVVTWKIHGMRSRSRGFFRGPCRWLRVGSGHDGRRARLVIDFFVVEIEGNVGIASRSRGGRLVVSSIEIEHVLVVIPCDVVGHNAVRLRHVIVQLVLRLSLLTSRLFQDCRAGERSRRSVLDAVFGLRGLRGVRVRHSGFGF